MTKVINQSKKIINLKLRNKFLKQELSETTQDLTNLEALNYKLASENEKLQKTVMIIEKTINNNFSDLNNIQDILAMGISFEEKRKSINFLINKMKNEYKEQKNELLKK